MASVIQFENSIPVDLDPRLESWPLTSSFRQVACLVAAYVLVVKVLGPAWMKGRRPYDVRGWMVAYNAVMVAGSFWVAKHLGIYYLTHSWRCEPVNYSYDEEPMKILFVFYVYYLMKYVEFLDTFFFVMRKKYIQVTNLHVYHHSIMPICTWYILTHGGGGYSIVCMLLNAITHVFMYTYYGLAAIGPHMQKYLWWKRYMTQIQLIQFTTGVIYLCQAYLFPTENCNVSLKLIAVPMYLCLQFFYLFSQFYMESYKSKKETPQQQ